MAWKSLQDCSELNNVEYKLFGKTSGWCMQLWSKSQFEFLSAATGQSEMSQLWVNYCKTNYTVSEAFLCTDDLKTEMDDMNIERPPTVA